MDREVILGRGRFCFVWGSIQWVCIRNAKDALQLPAHLLLLSNHISQRSSADIILEFKTWTCRCFLVRKQLGFCDRLLVDERDRLWHFSLNLDKATGNISILEPSIVSDRMRQKSPFSELVRNLYRQNMTY